MSGTAPEGAGPRVEVERNIVFMSNTQDGLYMMTCTDDGLAGLALMKGHGNG